MKISIVTISFNQARFLELALRSVIEQDYEDLQYIVVDPGSIDGSRDIIERYRSQIHKVIIEPDNGPADGLNKGFSYATGEILGFLNSDDVLFPGALRGAANSFRSHANVDVVSGHSIIIDADGRKIRVGYSDRFSPISYVYGASVLAQASTFFRSEVFATSGGFNVQNRSCWDGELFLEMALRGARFAVVDQLWSGFRVHSGSLTGTDQHLRRDMLRMFDKVMHRCPNHFDPVRSVLLRAAKHARDLRGVKERLLYGPVAGRYADGPKKVMNQV